mmetsp:Transcript_4158/g.9813  ORF Transcript_4158/g.9813 Transcript_4158/m.9813 type:complete len:208 (+) Transcript_4158:760-1383(+)
MRTLRTHVFILSSATCADGRSLLVSVTGASLASVFRDSMTIVGIGISPSGSIHKCKVSPIIFSSSQDAISVRRWICSGVAPTKDMTFLWFGCNLLSSSSAMSAMILQNCAIARNPANPDSHSSSLTFPFLRSEVSTAPLSSPFAFCKVLVSTVQSTKTRRPSRASLAYRRSIVALSIPCFMPENIPKPLFTDPNRFFAAFSELKSMR